ncbi:UNKNOWN [Stylonychia lemnae]|uniref:Uncharacterized protein n=1 Tax=Stylonychia lemnae TaxID=5949 RepID=A0A078AH02_STYLE|nr:UNKNOWN [Stylonychia lemnae]|eukprot:CDW81509.1 UNKNOWN [Stylonychia lemnae]
MLFLYFKDQKARAMQEKNQTWTTIYDDVVLPVFVERLTDEFNSDKILIGKEIEIILGNLADFLTGIALLYLCYHNGKFALKKRRKYHRKIKKQKKRLQSNFTENSNPNVLFTSNPASNMSRPNYGTESINSILMNPTSNNTTDKSNPVLGEQPRKINNFADSIIKMQQNINNDPTIAGYKNTLNKNKGKKQVSANVSFQFDDNRGDEESDESDEELSDDDEVDEEGSLFQKDYSPLSDPTILSEQFLTAKQFESFLRSLKSFKKIYPYSKQETLLNPGQEGKNTFTSQHNHKDLSQGSSIN